jgi:hypothetical protein
VPWPVLAMRRNDDPFLAKRMPSFFPDHGLTRLQPNDAHRMGWKLVSEA